MLTYFSPIFHFYIPWKRQKIFLCGAAKGFIKMLLFSYFLLIPCISFQKLYLPISQTDTWRCLTDRSLSCTVHHEKRPTKIFWCLCWVYLRKTFYIYSGIYFQYSQKCSGSTPQQNWSGSIALYFSMFFYNTYICR